MSPRLRPTSVPSGILIHYIQPFGHNRHGPKIGEVAQHNSVWTEVYRRTKWHLDTSSRLTTIDIARKMGRGGGYAPFLGSGAGSSSHTKSPGLRPTSTPSGILIRSAVWPQQTLAETWGRGSAPFFEGEPGPHPTMSLGQGLPSYQVTS